MALRQIFYVTCETAADVFRTFRDFLTAADGPGWEVVDSYYASGDPGDTAAGDWYVLRSYGEDGGWPVYLRMWHNANSTRHRVDVYLRWDSATHTGAMGAVAPQRNIMVADPPFVVSMVADLDEVHFIIRKQAANRHMWAVFGRLKPDRLRRDGAVAQSAAAIPAGTGTVITLSSWPAWAEAGGTAYCWDESGMDRLTITAADPDARAITVAASAARSAGARLAGDLCAFTAGAIDWDLDNGRMVHALPAADAGGLNLDLSTLEALTLPASLGPLPAADDPTPRATADMVLETADGAERGRFGLARHSTLSLRFQGSIWTAPDGTAWRGWYISNTKCAILTRKAQGLAVRQCLRLQWDALPMPRQALHLQWDAAQRVRQTLRLGWGIAFVAARQTLHLRYAQRMLATRKTLRLWWSAAHMPRQCLHLTWDALPMPRQGLHLVWDARPVARQALHLQWDAAAPARQSLHLVWDARPVARQGLHVQWDAAIPARQSLHLVWDARPVARQGLHLQWGATPTVRRCLHLIWGAEHDVAPGTTVTIGGLPVSPIAVRVTEDADQAVITATLEFAEALPPGLGPPAPVVIEIFGIRYALVGESYSRSREFGSRSWTLTAASPAYRLQSRYADDIEGDLTGPASAIARSLAGGIPLDWRMVDWDVLPGRFTPSGQAPLEAIRNLVSAAGGRLTSARDGGLVALPWPPHSPEGWPARIEAETDSLSAMISISDDADARDLRNAVTVSDEAGTGDLHIEEIPDTRIGGRAEVWVYQIPWRDDFDTRHTAAGLAVLRDLGIEERTIEEEMLEIVDGQGRTRYPIYAVLARRWNKIDLGAITPAEDGTITTEIPAESLLYLTYKTKARRLLVEMRAENPEPIMLIAED